jgi:NDP-sugar pyrophosphorylase family protein
MSDRTAPIFDVAVSPLTQVVVLAGGRGERLRPLTDSVPKPMAPIKGRPFLDYLLKSFLDTGLSEVLILLGYKGELIRQRYEKLSGLTVTFSQGAVNDGTGRRLINAYPLLREQFLLVYGDNYWPLNIRNLWHHYVQSRSSVQTTVFSNTRGTGEYGRANNITLGANGQVIEYDRSRKSSRCNGVDIGYFVVDKNILPIRWEGDCSFEEDLLPPLIRQGQLSGYVTGKQYHYITDLEALQAFEDIVAKNCIPYLNPTIFLG